jgi:predicted aspartyl protease
MDIPTPVKCLIDTGFSGGIALPAYYFSLFKNKIPMSTESFEFADGRQQTYPVYGTSIKVGRRRLDTKVMFIDNHISLVGISFLKHFAFNMDIPDHNISLDIKSF